MATYHLSAKPISRSTGRSATGAAAYRAGVEITDQRTGIVHDYTRKAGVLHTELILPGGGTADRADFWNGIEAHHKRGDAVLVREVEFSLPTELTAEQRQDLAVGFARELADRYGVAADVALHAPRTVTDRDLEKDPHQYHEIDPETGRRHNGNWHAHVMLSACHVQPDGTLGKKAVELDPIHCQRAKIENMADRERPRWGNLANAALERHGHQARIDHRSHAARGIEAEPSRHLGPAAASMERRTGEKSEKRIGWEQEAADRLGRAKELGQLERGRADLVSSIIDVAGDLKAALVERDQQLQIKQRQENEQRINSSLERIGSNVQAAGRAGADADRALLASKQSLITATGHTRDIERGAQGAIQGAERRVAERDYGRVVEAARRKFEIAGDVVQQVIGHIGHVVRPIAAAAQHIEIYTVERERQATERAQAARQALAATELSLRTQKTPVGPSRPSAAAVLANVATHLDQSNKSEPKARAVEAPAPTRLHADDAALFQRTEQSIAVAQASGSEKDIETLATRFRKIDQVESDLTRAATPNGWDTRPFDERSAAQQLANRDFDRRREAINAEAKAAGHTQLPFAVGQSTLISSTFDHSQKTAEEALVRHARSERPLGLFGRETQDTKAWDTQMETLETNKAGWDKAVAWRDGKEAAAITADGATFHKRLDVVRKEYTAKSDAAIAKCAPARERLTEFTKERERLERLADQALTPAKQRELSLERGRGHGMER